MLSKRFKFAKRPGLSPGTLVHVGEKKMERPRIRIIDYDTVHLQEIEAGAIEECFAYKNTETVTWINIDGLHDVALIDRFGKHFDLHPLLLEDIVHTTQRPKVEDFGEFVYIVLKMMHYDAEHREVSTEQFSLIVSTKYVITFQEKVGDMLEPIRERIRKGNQRIRTNGPDYLAYALIDAIIDSYFVIADAIGENLETLDEMVLENPDRSIVRAIHRQKHNIMVMRKAIAPARELLNSLIRDEYICIDEKIELYFRDAFDHVIRMVETLDSYREMLSSILEAYHSSVSFKMNEIMKVLTIIATIFIPLTFIAGVYGMNFKFMPELEWHWGYPLVWLIMVCAVVVMVIYFKRKDWL